MADFWPFLWIALGVLFSIVLPVLLRFVRHQFPLQAAPGPPPLLVKYGALLLFSGFTALLAEVVSLYEATHRL